MTYYNKITKRTIFFKEINQLFCIKKNVYLKTSQKRWVRQPLLCISPKKQRKCHPLVENFSQSNGFFIFIFHL